MNQTLQLPHSDQSITLIGSKSVPDEDIIVHHFAHEPTGLTAVLSVSQTASPSSIDESIRQFLRLVWCRIHLRDGDQFPSWVIPDMIGELPAYYAGYPCSLLGRHPNMPKTLLVDQLDTPIYVPYAAVTYRA